MSRKHRLDESKSRMILPGKVAWGPCFAVPMGARLAVLVDHPAESGLDVIRTEYRIHIGISGVLQMSLGEALDGDKVEAYPPGSVIVLPGAAWHFHRAKSGEYVAQVSAIGPLCLERCDLRDDPRRGTEVATQGEKKSNDHHYGASPPVQAGYQGRGAGLARRHADRVKHYIETNLDGAIRVSDLATIAQLSGGYFSKAFKVTFGQSPHAYIVSRRLARAKELMMGGETPLSFIAIDCGFSDQAHMCRQFRRANGVSPGLWRRDKHGGALIRNLQPLQLLTQANKP